MTGMRQMHRLGICFKLFLALVGHTYEVFCQFGVLVHRHRNAVSIALKSGFASGAASFCHCDSLTPQLSYKAHAGIISHAPDVRVDCNLESTICHNHEGSRLYDDICVHVSVRNTPRRLEAEVQVVYMV